MSTQATALSGSSSTSVEELKKRFTRTLELHDLLHAKVDQGEPLLAEYDAACDRVEELEALLDELEDFSAELEDPVPAAVTMKRKEVDLAIEKTQRDLEAAKTESDRLEEEEEKHGATCHQLEKSYDIVFADKDIQDDPRVKLARSYTDIFTKTLQEISVEQEALGAELQALDEATDKLTLKMEDPVTLLNAALSPEESKAQLEAEAQLSSSVDKTGERLRDIERRTRDTRKAHLIRLRAVHASFVRGDDIPKTLEEAEMLVKKADGPTPVPVEEKK